MVVSLFLFIKIVFHAIQLTLCIIFFLIDFPLTVLTLTNLTWIFIYFLLGINLGAKHARNTRGVTDVGPSCSIEKKNLETHTLAAERESEEMQRHAPLD
jgi:hypothetical protein